MSTELYIFYSLLALWINFLKLSRLDDLLDSIHIEQAAGISKIGIITWSDLPKDASHNLT